MSEEKKKTIYYSSPKEKPAREIKKAKEEIAPTTQREIEQDFNRMIEGFQRDFENFWGNSTLSTELRSTASPSVDLEDKGKTYQLTADLPGFKKEDIELELTDDAVTVSAQHSNVEDKKGKNFVRHERSSQMFFRKIALPEEILSDKATAMLCDGVLEVSLPKKAPKESKKLAIA